METAKFTALKMYSHCMTVASSFRVQYDRQILPTMAHGSKFPISRIVMTHEPWFWVEYRLACLCSSSSSVAHSLALAFDRSNEHLGLLSEQPMIPLITVPFIFFTWIEQKLDDELMMMLRLSVMICVEHFCFLVDIAPRTLPNKKQTNTFYPHHDHDTTK